MSTHIGKGTLNMPELIAGIATDLKPCSITFCRMFCTATFKLFLALDSTAFDGFFGTQGPTAWMTILHGRSPALVSHWSLHLQCLIVHDCGYAGHSLLGLLVLLLFSELRQDHRCAEDFYWQHWQHHQRQMLLDLPSIHILSCFQTMQLPFVFPWHWPFSRSVLLLCQTVQMLCISLKKMTFTVS